VTVFANVEAGRFLPGRFAKNLPGASDDLVQNVIYSDEYYPSFSEKGNREEKYGRDNSNS
jgi:hypothetical protein